MFNFLYELSFAIIVVIISAFVGLYFYLTRNFNYWSSRGVRGPKPMVLFGNLWDLLFKPVNGLEEERLKKYGNIYGVFLGTTPWLVVAEPELIKDILIKDFNNFVNRRVMGSVDDVLDRALSTLMDDEWKKLRSVVSPTFTSGKMKKMHSMVERCVNSVDLVLENAAKEGKEVEMKKLMGDYTMDVIASCAFATKTDTHNDPNNPFVKNAIKLFNANLWRTFVFIAMKPVMKFFRIPLLDSGVKGFFVEAIKEIIRQRKVDKSLGHHDFLQLMLNAQKKLKDLEDTDVKNDFESHHGVEDNRELVANRNAIEVTDLDIIATSFVFFLAGYETTANLLSHLIYFLALNPDKQQKLLEEVLENGDQMGNIDYETTVRLPYLDACISEALRLCNPAINTSRAAAQDYVLGDTGLTVPKGMHILIPIHAIHHSPTFYPEPHQFIPERFLPENRDKLIPYTYLPFGGGPRNCVGMRFALMETKTVIIKIILKYKFIRTNKTKVPLVYKTGGLLSAKDITVGLELRH